MFKEIPLQTLLQSDPDLQVPLVSVLHDDVATSLLHSDKWKTRKRRKRKRKRMRKRTSCSAGNTTRHARL